MTLLPDDVPAPIDFCCDKDAREWADNAMRRRPCRVGIFVAISRELAAANAQKVLELGSGPGFLAERLLMDHPNIEYTALDMSPAMHSLARQRLGASASRVDWVEADFKSDGWSKGLGRFDAIVTVQAVHELRHKRHVPALYAAVHGLLSPGGTFLMCDRFLESDGIGDAALFMTPEEHAAALEQGGFRAPALLLQGDGLVLFRCEKRDRRPSTP